MWMIKQNNNLLMTNPRPHLGSQKSWGPQLEESCTILADSYFHLRLPFLPNERNSENDENSE